MIWTVGFSFYELGNSVYTACVRCDEVICLFPFSLRDDKLRFTYRPANPNLSLYCKLKDCEGYFCTKCDRYNHIQGWEYDEDTYMSGILHIDYVGSIRNYMLEDHSYIRYIPDVPQ
jgi:hypothetical protein